MDTTKYGGLIETMYSQFSLEEIPENIKEYKERIDRLFLCKTSVELESQLNFFTEEERNYLSCTLLDNLFLIKSEDYLALAVEKNVHESVFDLFLACKEKLYSAKYMALSKCMKMENYKFADKLIPFCGRTMLHEVACSASGISLSSLQYLIRKNINMELLITKLLFNSSKLGNLQVLQFLEEKYNMGDTFYMNNAILEACYSGKINIIKYIMEKYKIYEEKKREMIEILCDYGHTEIIRFLAETWGDNFWATANHVTNAVRSNYDNREIIRILVENMHGGINEQAFEESVIYGNKDYAKFFLEKGFDINSQDFISKTSDIDMHKFLIENGAIVHGHHIVNCALGTGDKVEHMKYLFSAMESRGETIKTSVKNKALKNAIKTRNLEMVKFLCEKGANVYFVLCSPKNIREYLVEKIAEKYNSEMKN